MLVNFGLYKFLLVLWKLGHADTVDIFHNKKVSAIYFEGTVHSRNRNIADAANQP